MVDSLTWRKITPKGDLPTARSGHSFTFVDSSAYLFGGAFEEKEDSVVLYNDMFKLDVSVNPPLWSKVAQKGSVPTKREGHSVSASGKILYLFGGTGPNQTCFDDFYAFDTTTSTWTTIKGKGTPPSKRNNHSACAVNSKVYIFGGFLSGVAGNDIHCYDIKTDTWSQPPVKGALPIERVDHSWTPFGSKLVLFGGAGDEVWYNDLHVYNTETSTWATPPTKGPVPGKRDYHTMVNFDEKHLILFGGAYESEEIIHYNDVNVFSTTNLTWTPLTLSGPVPAKRWGHVAGIAKGFMWIHGGSGSGQAFDDLWALGPSSATPPGAATAAATAAAADENAPKKPPRGALPSPVVATPAAAAAVTSPTSSSSSSGKLAPGLTPVTPIPPAKPVYTTMTPIPAQRRTAPSVKPFTTTPRSLKTEYEKAATQLKALFDDIEAKYSELDQEKAAHLAERSEFAEEVRLNLAQYDQQQKELADLIEKHHKENDDLLAKRQQQYEQQMAEVARKQNELTDRESKLNAALAEFEDKKKKMEQLMAQFTSIKM